MPSIHLDLNTCRLSPAEDLLVSVADQSPEWARGEGSGLGEPLITGCGGSFTHPTPPALLTHCVHGFSWQALFQVDDAMLMFDKTTNRHRGEGSPYLLPRLAPGVGRGVCGQPGGRRSQLPFHLAS